MDGYTMFERPIRVEDVTDNAKASSAEVKQANVFITVGVLALTSIHTGSPVSLHMNVGIYGF